MAFDPISANTISWFYAAAFGRTPVPNSTLPDNGDLNGLTFWTDTYLEGEGSLAVFNRDSYPDPVDATYAIADFFVQDSKEFQDQYGQLNDADYVTALYKNLLGRDPDNAGMAFWLEKLTVDDYSRGRVLADFTNTNESRSYIPARADALESFITFIAADADGTITKPESDVWLAANPTLDAKYVDTPLTFALTSTGTVAEGSELVFTLTASVDSFADQTFAISIVGDNLNGSVGMSSPDDFTSPPTSVTLLKGQTSVTFGVKAAWDNVAEGAEGFKVTLLNGSTAIASAEAVITDSSDTTAPMVAANQELSYDENQKAGDVVATVAATDNEGGSGVVSFEIVSGNDEGYFAIDNKGELSLTAAGAAATSPANHALISPNSFVIGVEATDAAGNMSTATNVTLEVNDITPPDLSKTSLSGSTLVMTFNEPLDPTSVPAGGSFTVLQGGSTAITVNSVAIAGTTVTLGLAASPTTALTVAYSPPAVNPLQDVAGNDVEVIANRNVLIDNTPPSIVTLSPTDEATSVGRDSDLMLTFDEAVFLSNGTITLTNPSAATDTRTITIVNGQVAEGSAGTVVIADKMVTIDLSKELLANINYQVAITDGTFKDAAGNAFVGGGLPGDEGWDFTTTQVDGQTFTLTANQDIFPGDLDNSGNDVLRGVAGVGVGQQDQTTLNSSDILDGGEGSDTLVVLLNGDYGGGATIKAIETLQLGTDIAVAAPDSISFNYNVNQGKYEVTGVNTIVADQITNNTITGAERLAINNVVPTAVGEVTPTLSWENEANAVAGTVSLTYREESVKGAADNQQVALKNVAGGTLNIGGDMETITLDSVGTVTNNTLFYSENLDAGPNNNPADILSAGSLTQVVITGGVAMGQTAGIITTTGDTLGLTDRAIGGDDGGIAGGTGTNLLSVGSRVTTVDASVMTGAANVRFVAKTDGTATNVTFKGGESNDYVEFELGNVNATGGKGSDTFAFITNAAGVTNSTFGAGDHIDGGEGSDILQLGVNGIGNYTLSTTEFSNTKGIETLDLRGNVNSVTVSSSLVSGVDVEDATFTIRTDRMVQTSATNADNPTGASVAEDNSVNTVRLIDLNAEQGVEFMGGSGSDRLVLNNGSFNQSMGLNGGTNVGNTRTPATAGDYDTLNVMDSSVLDRTDLSKVSGFEGLVLVESGTGDTTFAIELTQAFLLANTKTPNDPRTSIDDRIFQIGTTNAANGNHLEAGDRVTLDISDLLNANRTAKALADRWIDTTLLDDAGVDVRFIVDGKELNPGIATDAALIDAVTDVDAARNDVIVASAADPGVIIIGGNTLTATADGFDTSTGFLLTGGTTTNLADTLNSEAAQLVGSTIKMADGTDILNITTGAGGVDLSVVATADAAEIVNLNAGAAGAGFINADGTDFRVDAQAASIVTLGTGGQTFNGSTGADVVTGNTGSDRIRTEDGADTVVDGAGDDAIWTGAGNDVVDLTLGDDGVNLGDGADVARIILSGNDVVRLGTVDPGETILDTAADQIAILNTNGFPNAIMAVDTDQVTIRDFNIANDKLVLGATVNGVLESTSFGVFVNEAIGGQNPVTPITNLGTGTILEISSASYQYAGTSPDESALLAHINGVMLATGAANAAITVVAYDGSGNAAIFQAQETDGALSGFDAIELVGIVEAVGVNALSAANFA